MSSPDVSVVIATRDRPDFLRRAVAAALEQDYDGRIEVVVVFDQSSPEYSLECQSGRRQVRIVANDRSPGLAGARNCGAEASTADLLSFCDDDDIWLPGKLRRQVQCLAGGYDTVVTGIVIDYVGKLTERVPTPADVTLAGLIRRRSFEAHPSTVVVRRAAFVGSIGEVDEEIPGGYGEDYDWIIRAARHGTIGVVPEPLVRVLWHQASFFAGRWETILLALDYLLAKHPEFAGDPTGLARIYGQKAFAHSGLGHRREAAHWAVQALRLSWRERRPYLALLVSFGLLRPESVLRWAHAAGRGI
ncbi:MAG: glycosyltransferase family 2 protein [Frankiaceae bacterium]